MLTFKLNWTEQKEETVTYDDKTDLFYNQYGFVLHREEVNEIVNTKMLPETKEALAAEVKAVLAAKVEEKPAEEPIEEPPPEEPIGP